MYNSRIARFYTIDKLTAKYPWYSPYQFAGNTPIAAIDLDGLEQYIKTYRFEDGKVTILNVVDNSYVVYTWTGNTPQVQTHIMDKRTGKPMNPSEIGMEQYVYVDNNGKELSIHKHIDGKRYVKGIAPMISVKEGNWFGSTYIGPNNPEINTGKVDEKGKPIMKDDYRRQPQDLMDASAEQHDRDYDEADAHGFTGAVFKRKAIAADIALVQRANKVMEMYENKEIDPFTGKQVSEKTYERASTVSKGFTYLALEKSKINPIKQLIILRKLGQKRKVDYTPTKPADN